VKNLIVSAPFGNWVDSEHATSTLGTYTLEDRAGFCRWWMAWRILRTLRYRFAMGGWSNKLGLPSPGIDHLEKIAIDFTIRNSDPAWVFPLHPWVSTKIVSIHGFNEDEWRSLLSRQSLLGGFDKVEVNLGCPNVGHISVPDWMLWNAVKSFGSTKIIVKLPPVSYWKMFEMAYAAGVRWFHCTNTLPVPAGGLSGKALKRVALDVVERIKSRYGCDVNVIGGGGITEPQDIKDFRSAGADKFAVGSGLLHPRGWLRSTRETFLRRLADEAAS
jgi:dihydroorotate dehydrogenase